MRNGEVLKSTPPAATLTSPVAAKQATSKVTNYGSCCNGNRADNCNNNSTNNTNGRSGQNVFQVSFDAKQRTNGQRPNGNGDAGSADVVAVGWPAAPSREREGARRFNENRNANENDDNECGGQKSRAPDKPDQADNAGNSGLLFRLAERIPGLGIMLSLVASFFLGSAGMLVKLTQSVHGIQIAVLR